MPLFSAFTPFGAGFAFSGAPSHGETIFRSMLSALGKDGESYSTEEGTRMRAFCYAGAMHAARVKYTLEHAGYQLDPLKVTECLPLREGEYGLIPGPNEPINERRAALAARLLAAKGGSYNTIKNALITLLGNDFVQYIPTAYVDSARSPMDCGDQPMSLVPTANRLPQIIRLLDPISLNLGTAQWVRYEVVELPFVPEPADGSTLPPRDLVVGDRLIVDPGNNTVAEAVLVTGLRNPEPGVFEVQGTFWKPHSADILASSATFPYWLSTKRHNLAVLVQEAALDPETRRKTNELLERMLRVVSTWNIVQEDPANPGHTGVFQAGTFRANTMTVGDVIVPL